MKREFLRGYLLGDGTVVEGKISFTTTSYEIASGLVYLLSSFGVVASQSQMQPDGIVRQIRGTPCQTKLPYWTTTISAAEDLIRLEPVWRDHACADRLRARLSDTGVGSNRRFELLNGDLMGLPIRSIEEVTPSNGPAGINLRLPQGPEMVRLRRTDLRGLPKRRPLGGRSQDLASLFHVRNERGGAAVELLGAGCRDHKDSNPKPEQ